MTRPCLWAIDRGLLLTRFQLLIRIDNCLVSSGEHRGIALTHVSILNGLSPVVPLLCFCAFELAIASCTPLVANKLLSPLLRLPSPLLPKGVERGGLTTDN